MGVQDIHDDFEFARHNWDKLGLDISLDDALEKFNESEYADESWYSKPIYSEDAWNQMIKLCGGEPPEKEVIYDDKFGLEDEFDLAEESLKEDYESDYIEQLANKASELYNSEEYREKIDDWFEKYNYPPYVGVGDLDEIELEKLLKDLDQFIDPEVEENLVEGAMSNGSYSLYNGWVKEPDKDAIPDEYPELEPEYSEWVERANKCESIEDIDNFLDDVYKLRQEGLLSEGEYGKSNLIFKELRNEGVLQKLKDMKVEKQNKDMSLESLNESKVYKDIHGGLGEINATYTMSDLKNIWDEDHEFDPSMGEYDSFNDWVKDTIMNYMEEVDESLNEEVEETNRDRAQELADYLGIDVEDVEDGYTDNVFEADGEEWYVLTYDEAEEEAKQEVLSLIDDMGLQSFSKDYQEYIIDNYVDEDFIMDALQEEIDYYRDEEEDEETANWLENMDFAEAFNYFRDMFDDKSFYNWVKDHIDWNGVAEDVVRTDGPENSLASYDGEEIELDKYYAYRIN